MSTTIKAGWLKDAQGDRFAPRTLISQISNEEGTTLEGYIDEKLKNSVVKPDLPPLTFVGAVEATYDGSEPIEVNIPQGANIEVDAELKGDSENPIQNKAVASAIDELNERIDNINIPEELVTNVYVAQNEAPADTNVLWIDIDDNTSGDPGSTPESEAGVGANVADQEFVIGNGSEEQTVIAEQGAEIFNDYEQNIAVGAYSHAEGTATLATGEASHAEGYNSKALGDYTHAEGEETIAKGYGAHSEGEYTIAIEDAAHAEGGGWSKEISLTGSDYEYALSSGSFDQLFIGAVIVYNNLITKIEDIDVENEIFYTEDDLGELENESVTIYLGGIASDYTAHVEGDSSGALAYAAHAEGSSTFATEDAAHSEGSCTYARGYAAHAEGSDNIAAEFADHAEGSTTVAAGGASHAEGDSSIAFGYASHSEGESIAIGPYSHAEGCRTVSYGDYSHSEGEGNVIYTQSVITKISNNLYQLDKEYDIKVGDIVVVNNYLDKFGCAEISEYDQENLTIKIKQATGSPFFYAGDYDSWERTEFLSNSIAFGDYSHIEGKETIAYGRYAHVQGIGTIAPQANMDVTGRFNSLEYGYEKSTIANQNIVLTTIYHIDDFVFDSEIGKFMPVNKASESSDHTNIIIGDLYVDGDSDQDGFYSEIYEIIGEPKYNTPPYGASPYYTAPYYKYYAGHTAEGKYAHIVGNGISDTERSNAHTLDWDGNAWFAGDIYVGGTSQKDGDRLARISEISSGGAGVDENTVLITLEDIDAICGGSIKAASEVLY